MGTVHGDAAKEGGARRLNVGCLLRRNWRNVDECLDGMRALLGLWKRICHGLCLPFRLHGLEERDAGFVVRVEHGFHRKEVGDVHGRERRVGEDVLMMAGRDGDLDYGINGVECVEWERAVSYREGYLMKMYCCS